MRLNNNNCINDSAQVVLLYWFDDVVGLQEKCGSVVVMNRQGRNRSGVEVAANHVIVTASAIYGNILT